MDSTLDGDTKLIICFTGATDPFFLAESPNYFGGIQEGRPFKIEIPSVFCCPKSYTPPPSDLRRCDFLWNGNHHITHS